MSARAVLLSLAMVGARSALAENACLDCHGEAGQQAQFPDGAVVSISVDGRSFTATAHGDLACTDCHEDIDLDSHPPDEMPEQRALVAGVARACLGCHSETAEAFAHDLHGGKDVGLSCPDCHDAHFIPPKGPSRESVPHMCQRCHAEMFSRYARSAHGGALLAHRNGDVPNCADCHVAHRITRASTPEFHMASVDLCRRCHGDAAKMARYGLSTDVLTSYLDDFHGVSVTYSRRGNGGGPSAAIKATCVDCHGAHDIPRRGTAESLSVSENLAPVCARCHPGASASFSKAWLSHYIPSPTKAQLPYFVRMGYTVFIPFVIVGLVAHVGLDLVRLRRHPKRHAKGTGALLTRFSPWRRAEHVLVVTSFMLLVLTGVPQKFHDSALGESLIALFGGMESNRAIHRVAGVVFAVQAVVHLAVNGALILMGTMRPHMLVTRRDFAETIALVRHSLGRTDSTPRFDRYDGRQKFEYWGILVGGAVMITTGFILMYPLLFSALLPGQLIPAAKMAHSFEAVMALLVIVVWHFYCAIFSPEVFPLDRSVFTGRISEERMKEEHPLEWERLRGSAPRKPPSPSDPPPPSA